MQDTYGTSKSPKLINFRGQYVTRLLKRMWTSRYYSSVKHEGRCMYQIFDPADLQKISAFSRACKFSHAKLLSHLNQSECKANVTDKKKKNKNQKPP